MSNGSRAATSAMIAAALLVCAGLPAAGDWLVTREGGRVETRGAWKVKGKLVVFTGKDGSLASLRLAEVDLEASEKATHAAAAAAEESKRAPAEEPPRRKSVRVVTDADVAHVDPATLKKEAEPEDTDAASEKPVAGNSVVVRTWERKELPGKEGLEVVGELRNNGSEIATDLRVTVTLFDEVKEILGMEDALLDATVLRPGGTQPFRAVFQGVFAFADAKFDVQSFGLKVKAGSPKKEGDEPPPP